jgi:hypothetical protein
LVAPPESQRSHLSWSLQPKCYRKSIFIHYTYVTFYACSFPHYNIHTYIMYIFRVSISTCMCPHDSVYIYIYESLTVIIEVLNCLCLNYYCLRPEPLLSELLLSKSWIVTVWTVTI